MRALQIGYDSARITIPIRNHDSSLRGVLRYDPFGPRNPKMLASPGTRSASSPTPPQSDPTASCSSKDRPT